MILLYIESGWEKDYIIKYVLKDVRFTNYFVIAREHLTESFIRKLRTMSSEFVVVFSSNNMSYTTIESLVRELKPKVVIHNSDEWGKRKEFVQLSTLVPLMITQYKFYYKFPTNVLHLPLPYLTGVHVGGVPDFNSVKPPKQRKYDWAFIGELKHDRAYAIRMFKELWKDSVYFEGKASRVEMSTVYKDARFVIAPRGNVTMMTCRMFEAITCGAIPVIACSKEEMEPTFNFGGRTPQFVYARTWEDAVDACRSIQNLDDMQQKCVNWYKSIHDSIRTEIQYALKS